MFQLFIDKANLVNYDPININDGETRIIVDLLKNNFSVEIWSSGCPLVNYQDAFIETDSDGFARIKHFAS